MHLQKTQSTTAPTASNATMTKCIITVLLLSCAARHRTAAQDSPPQIAAFGLDLDLSAPNGKITLTTEAGVVPDLAASLLASTTQVTSSGSLASDSAIPLGEWTPGAGGTLDFDMTFEASCGGKRVLFPSEMSEDLPCVISKRTFALTPIQD